MTRRPAVGVGSVARARAAILAVAAVTIGAATLRAQGEPTPPRDTARRTTVSADAGYTSFDSGIEPWRTFSVAVARRGAAGSVIARVNGADRFGTAGMQVELDAYPRLGPGRYLYLNAGYSPSSVFVGQRFGAEFYTNLPDAWEASIGLRNLWFDGDPVTLYTGTIGRYTGNYWLSLRPFVRMEPTGTSASAGLSVRRYTADADNYVGARISFGSSPSDNVTPDAVARTRSASFSVQGSRTFGTSLMAGWSASHDSEELVAGGERASWSVTLGIGIRY